MTEIMKEKKMAKQYRILFFIIGIVVLAGFVSCTTYKGTVAVTDEMAEQIATIKFYVPKAEDEIKTIYINRRLYNSGWFKRGNYDLIRDLNAYKRGVWYREHQGKIVSIEPYEHWYWRIYYGDETDRTWQIEYVD
jgi:hypothetical protein